jgi:hypothetical protein
VNLVSFSIKTKGVHNFARRLRTVFTRFGFSEDTTRRALLALLQTLQPYQTSPTFFIPAVVLHRHARLIAEIAGQGAEFGIHGHVHNDYRTLSVDAQYTQTQQAIEVFTRSGLKSVGFRNPYLGWTEESLEIFRQLGFYYESNEAVLHEVVPLKAFSPLLQKSFARSLELFQAIPCTTYTLRPHFEGTLLRIPTSIPDDEMLFDRLRVTDPLRVGQIWNAIMERVYACEGLYTLNLHPERSLLCQPALAQLLQFANNQPLPVWVAHLHEVTSWWQERTTFRMEITSLDANRWAVKATCSERATILARHMEVENQSPPPWFSCDQLLTGNEFIVQAPSLPCLVLSARTANEVADFLYEQGYPVTIAEETSALTSTACYFDLPEGLGSTRQEQIRLRSTLLQQIETLDVPLLRFGYWPSGQHAALAISSDIDSVTIQDFFLRILEVR